MRREFPAKVKVLAFNRAKGNCEKCGVRLSVGKIHYDHVIADALGGEPTLDNCQVLCVGCHGRKTHTKDRPDIQRAKDRREKHIGAKKPRGFWKPPNTRYDWRLGRHVIDKET